MKSLFVLNACFFNSLSFTNCWIHDKRLRLLGVEREEGEQYHLLEDD